MLISEAFAQTAEMAQTATEAPNGMVAIMQFAFIFIALYFILIRPQQKKIKRHEAALNAITKGSKVVVGGIIGTVTKVSDNGELTVKIADNTEITVIKGYIAQVLDEK